jgi:hypothetical protein
MVVEKSLTPDEIKGIKDASLVLLTGFAKFKDLAKQTRFNVDLFRCKVRA